MNENTKTAKAGKPRLPEEQLRRNQTLRLSVKTCERLKAIRAAGFQTSRVIDDLVEAFCIHAGLADFSNLGACDSQE
jgi:hypothetical protein